MAVVDLRCVDLLTSTGMGALFAPAASAYDSEVENRPNLVLFVAMVVLKHGLNDCRRIEKYAT